MARKLLHTFGINEENNIVHINDADKSKNYFCPLCNERIIARKGGETQRPHFAHFKKSKEGCNGESLLIQLFRKQAFALLQKHLKEGLAFTIEWSCPYCHRKYQRNLLKQISKVEERPTLSNMTPDLTLYNKEGKAVIAFEIILRRKLTKKTIERYESAGILLIQLHIDEKDVMNVATKLQYPDAVGFCANAECYNFQFSQHTFRREIFVQKFKCKKCAKVVDGYMVRRISPFGLIGLDHLNDNEKQTIVSKYFHGKRAVVADIVVYGKCRCIPHSKGLVCLTKSDAIQETQQGKITRKK